MDLDWIENRSATYRGRTSDLVPPRFSKYYRLFHPVETALEGSFEAWAAVAQRNQRVMHPLAQFHAISTPATIAVDNPPKTDFEPGVRRDPGPWVGSLRRTHFQWLVSILAASGASHDVCYGLWDGYAGFEACVASAPVASLPLRKYYLFQGSLSNDAECWFDFITRCDGHVYQSPNIMWPTDRRWFVATGVDFSYTIIGCDPATGNLLAGQSLLEVASVRPNDDLSVRGDRINV